MSVSVNATCEGVCMYECEPHLSCGPGVVHVSPQVLRGHHIVGTSVGLGNKNKKSKQGR